MGGARHDRAAHLRARAAHVLNVLSYYNMPVVSTPRAKHNPWRMLRALARVEDLMVVKLDIDHGPTEHEALVEQVRAPLDLPPISP